MVEIQFPKKTMVLMKKLTTELKFGHTESRLSLKSL